LRRNTDELQLEAEKRIYQFSALETDPTASATVADLFVSQFADFSI
jgi:hypothetical protein